MVKERILAVAKPWQVLRRGYVKSSILSIILLTSCSFPPRQQVVSPKLPETAPSVKRLQPMVLQRATNNWSVVIPWLYPTNINPNYYTWILQSTTDFVNWVDLDTNMNVVATNPFTFYRLKGIGGP